MNENTRFEEYERKTRKIILTIGIIAGIFFLFGLLVISSDEENYNPEETSPDFVENQNILPDVSVDTEPVFIDTEDTPVSERKKPIKVTPAQINMNKFILGVDTQNQSVLTIGTDGSESIHIERVELVEETEDGFEFRDKCRNRDLRGDETCNVLITWVPHLPGNVQNNFKIIWYETRLDKSSAKSEEVSIKGSAVYPEDTRQGCDASTGCSIGGDGIGAHRLAIGPNGEIIGYIDEAGNVHDRDGNIIGRVNEDGMVVDSDGNIIGVAQNMKLAYDKDGNIIGYVKTDGTVVDLQGEVIGKALPDGTIVTGRTTELFGAASAAMLNALKAIAGIDDAVKLISPDVIGTIQTLKTDYMKSHNPRLHTDEMLVALAISAASDHNAMLAMQALDKLKKCEAHSTVILSSVDDGVFKRLGMRMTCEPIYENNSLYHK